MPTITMQVQKIEYAPNESRLTATCVNGQVQGTLTISAVGKQLLRMFDAGDSITVTFGRAQ